MSKFKLTQTATEVQNILNNSLQKPTGLTKTKLVGVGVNGQENIEIGDNLTLANGKLAATGSLPSTVKFDAEGNRTVGKNLEVDGAIKLSSLDNTFTNGKLPVNYVNYNGSIVYSSVSKTSQGGSTWYSSPLFFKQRSPQYSDCNPRCTYAYNSDDNQNLRVADIALQGTVAVSTITIKNSDMSLQVCYLNSAYNTGNYVIPQTGLIKDYSSFVYNLNKNKGLFISLSGYTKFGAPLSLVYTDGKPYVRVVNTTTLEESDILIPNNATLSVGRAELLSQY